MADYNESFKSDCKKYAQLGAQLEQAKQEVASYAKAHTPNVQKAKKDMAVIMQQYKVGCLYDKPNDRYIVRRERVTYKPMDKFKDAITAQVATIKDEKSGAWKKKKEAVEAIVEAIQAARRAKSVSISFTETKPKTKVDECPKEVLDKYGADMSRVTRIAVETERRLAKLRSYLKLISTRMTDLEPSLKAQFEEKKYMAVPVECKLSQAPEMLKIARLTNSKPSAEAVPPEEVKIKRYISFAPVMPRKSAAKVVNPPKKQLVELVSSLLPDDLNQLRQFEPQLLVDQVIKSVQESLACQAKAKPQGPLGFRMAVVKKKPAKPKSGKF